ncbi:zinc-ribbon domain-containing protein [Mediterraneibacter catenae]|uniref:Zinc-ribbon domain-containing protein n=1 Tax=Mediterraneibacter catenae TaxID=2594882 RepID=A0A5M9HZ32_9FIRM|nr:CD225/dispanin family protein [Mediterraneibacter catenae]KAA8501947.1 zinc-ribbon domain-containing protein [Mediterraneibacter catenae]
MNCTNCYQEIPDGSRFCPHCGAKQPEPAAQTETDQSASDAYSTYTQTNSTQQDTQYQDPNAQNYGYDYQNSQYQTPPVYQSAYEPEKPINWVPYLVLSIISTVCCLPFGIVGIVYAAKINSAMNAGDYAEAERSARLAKIWIIVAFVVGIIVNVIYTLMIFAGIGNYYYY